MVMACLHTFTHAIDTTTHTPHNKPTAEVLQTESCSLCRADGPQTRAHLEPGPQILGYAVLGNLQVPGL